MVKKSSKGKEKKLARKADNERAAALAVRVKELNEASSAAAGDLLAALYPAFTRYDRKGLNAAVRFYAADGLPSQLLEWALDLTRTHMAELYDACPDWGWSDAKKRAELADPAARFLFVFEQQPAAQAAAAPGAAQEQPAAPAAAPAAAAAAAPPLTAAAAAAALVNGPAAASGGLDGAAAAQPEGRPVAFVHFRYEAEEGQAVLYCYEIQVAAAVQGKGLGRFLMQLLELLGRRGSIDRLMLTVFHANTAATALYRRLGYVLDEGSPGALDPAGGHMYEILTKALPPPKATAMAPPKPSAAKENVAAA